MDKLLFKYYISKQLFVDYKKFVGLHKIFAWFICQKYLINGHSFFLKKTNSWHSINECNLIYKTSNTHTVRGIYIYIYIYMFIIVNTKNEKPTSS